MRVLELVSDSARFNGVNVDTPDYPMDVLALAAADPPSWRPVEATPYRDPHRRRQPIGDLVEFLPPLPIVSRRFRSVLDGFGHDKIAYFPVTIHAVEFYIMSVREYSDELDVERSRFERFQDGEIMDVLSYAFTPAPVKAIFKPSAIGPMSPVMINDTLFDELHRQGLTGVAACREIWRSS